MSDVRRFCTTVAAATLVMARPAAAQAPGSLEIGLYGQISRVDPAQGRFETRSPLSLGARGRINLHRQFGLELEASTGIAEGADAQLERRYNQLVARGTLTVPMSDFSGLILGAGVARSDYEITYNFGASALLGVRTVIRGRYALRSDAIFNYLPASGASELGLRTGLQIVIGPFAGPSQRDRANGNLTVQAPATLEAGAFAHFSRLDPVWNLQNATALGTRVGAFITSRSQAEVDATYRRQSVRSGGQPGQTGTPLPAGGTYRVTSFALRYNHNIPVGTRYAIVAGAGPSRSSVEYIDYWGVSLLSGARVALTRDLQLRVDGTANLMPGPRAIDGAVRVGLSTLVRLGR